jgi:hypothetical protein
VLDELVHLFEGAFIEQEFDALADGEFPFGVLPLTALRPSAFVSRRVASPEFFEAIHQD